MSAMSSKELVAAVAGQEVGGAAPASQPAGELVQQLVPAAWPEGVVDEA